MRRGPARVWLRACGAALALGVFTLFGASASAQTCPTGICGADTLTPFFHALHEAKSGSGMRTVHILQIGDSHTANDYIAGALRDQLQYVFGHGGRGVLPVGLPYFGYDPRLVQVTQTGAWRVNLSFAPPPNPRHPEQPHLYTSPPPFGLTGFRLTTDSDATLTLDAEAGARFTRAVVCALSEPGAGVITLSAGGDTRPFPLATDHREAVCHEAHFSSPQQHLDVSASGGPVSLLSWAIFADGGVALSNLGVSGTQLKDLAERDDAVMAAELDAYRPDLIILAYGTNEGYVPNADAGAYEALLRGQIERLQRLSHDAPILVLGAPDANTIRPDLYGSGGVFPNCAPLSDEETQDYAMLVQTRSPRLARWFPPAGLAQIRAAQRRAADEVGVAFWDWEAREGGPCSAHRMGLEDPKLVRGDHIHYTVEGGVKIAGLLYADLMSADAALTATSGGAR